MKKFLFLIGFTLVTATNPVSADTIGDWYAGENFAITEPVEGWQLAKVQLRFWNEWDSRFRSQVELWVSDYHYCQTNIYKVNGQKIKVDIRSADGGCLIIPTSQKGKDYVFNQFLKKNQVTFDTIPSHQYPMTFSAKGFTKSVQKLKDNSKETL